MLFKDKVSLLFLMLEVVLYEVHVIMNAVADVISYIAYYHRFMLYVPGWKPPSVSWPVPS